MLRGKCHDRERDFVKAAQEYSLAIEWFAKHEQDEGVRGNLEFRLGWSLVRGKQDVFVGLSHLTKASELIPDNPEILLKIATAIMQELPDRPDYQDQLTTTLQKVLLLDPTNTEGLHLSGKHALKQDQFAEGLKFFEECVKHEMAETSQPKGTTFFYMGQCQEGLKDFKAAMIDFKKCLTLDNNHFGSCIHLANLLANLGEGQRAAKYFKHALKVDPDSVNAHFGLGKAIQQFSDDKEAPVPHF